MITFYLVRHASYTEKHNLLPGRLPVELSEEGIKEAEKLQNYFEGKIIEKIYSSEVLRCKQTSEIISNGKIPIEYDKRLLEALGAYQGFWDPDAWDQFWGNRHKLGGESRKNVSDRAIDFFKNTNFEEGKNYIISSHMDPLYFIYQFAVNAKPLNEIELCDTVFKNDECQEKGSVRIIVKENRSYRHENTILQKDL